MTDIQTRPLLATTSMTPFERQQGRFMRAPDGHEGGTQTPVADNTGGNPNPNPDPNATPNNTSKPDGIEDFWTRAVAGDEPAGGAPGSDGKTPAAAQAENDEFGKTLSTRMAGIKFDPIMTPQFADELGEGKFDGFNAAIHANMAKAVQEGLGLSVQVMQRFGQQLMQAVEAKLGTTLNSRDNSEALESAFPAAKDPKVRPVIQNVFNRALEIHKGDRNAAIKTTKDMLAAMHGVIGGGDGLNIPPPNPGDSSLQSPTNWLEALNVR